MTHINAATQDRAELMGVDADMLASPQPNVVRDPDPDELSTLAWAVRQRLTEIGSDAALYADGQQRLERLVMAEANAEDWLDEAGHPLAVRDEDEWDDPEEEWER